MLRGDKLWPQINNFNLGAEEFASMGSAIGYPHQTKYQRRSGHGSTTYYHHLTELQPTTPHAEQE